MRLLARQFATAVTVAVLVGAPLAAIAGGLTAYGAWEGAHRYPSQTGVVGGAVTGRIVSLGAAEIVVFLLLPVMSAAFVSAAGERFLGSRAELGWTLGRFGRRLPAVIAAAVLAFGMLLAFAVVVAGALGTMIVEIVHIDHGAGANLGPVLTVVVSAAIAALAFALLVWTSAFVSVAGPVAVLERAGGWTAVRKAFGLQAGAWTHTLAVTFLVTQATAGAAYLIGYLVIVDVRRGSLHDAVVWGGVRAALIAVLTAPLAAMCVAVLAVDLRIRRENYDVERLAVDLADSAERVARAHEFSEQPVPLVGRAARLARLAGAEQAGTGDLPVGPDIPPAPWATPSDAPPGPNA